MVERQSPKLRVVGSNPSWPAIKNASFYENEIEGCGNTREQVDKRMNIISSSKQFLHEVRIEMAKVIWPSWDEFVGSTIVVLFLVAVFAIYLGLLDAVLSVIIRYIFKIAI